MQARPFFVFDQCFVISVIRLGKVHFGYSCASLLKFGGMGRNVAL